MAASQLNGGRQPTNKKSTTRAVYPKVHFVVTVKQHSIKIVAARPQNTKRLPDAKKQIRQSSLLIPGGK